MFGKRQSVLNIDTSASRWSIAEDDFTSLNSDSLPSSELSICGLLL